MLKSCLQSFIVRTSFGPLGWIYRSWYNLALKIITAVFKRQPDVAAVYLISSLAMGEQVPGLSDIDLIIVAKDTNGSKERIGDCYARLARIVPFLKYDERGIYSIEDIKCSYGQSDFYLKFKLLTECKKFGKLLCGRDVLGDFKELDAEERNEFLLGQLAFIWSIFLKKFLLKDSTTQPLIINYTCYKLTADVCRTFISARDGNDIFSRRKILEHVAPSLTPDQQAHVLAITQLAQRKFTGFNPQLVSETYTFCLEVIQKTIEHMPTIPEKGKDREEFNRAYYDLESVDIPLLESSRNIIDKFVNSVKTKYSEYIESVLVSPFDLFHMDGQNIGIFVVAKKHIPWNTARELVALLGGPKPLQRLNLYLVRDAVAISLNSFDPRRYHSAVCSLRWMSFTLLYLSTLKAVRWGAPLNYAHSKKLVVNYFWRSPWEAVAQDKMAIRKVIGDRDILRISNIEFQRFFWQALRLNIIESSLGAGRMFIPLTSDQVCQYFQKNKESKQFLWFNDLNQEYQKDLQGIPSDSEFYFPRALAFLKELYAAPQNAAT